MTKPILQNDFHCETLRQLAKPLSTEDILSDNTQSLISEMIEIMRAAPGVGLAATQIGVPLQIAVIEDPADRLQTISPTILKDRNRAPIECYTLINPKITSQTGKTNYFFEGCLSVAGRVRITPRQDTITVEYLNERAEKKIITASGWHARILQHEIDHLNGKLYTDIADERTELPVDDHYKNKWVNAMSEEIQAFYREKCQNKNV